MASYFEKEQKSTNMETLPLEKLGQCVPEAVTIDEEDYNASSQGYGTGSGSALSHDYVLGKDEEFVPSNRKYNYVVNPNSNPIPNPNFDTKSQLNSN